MRPEVLAEFGHGAAQKNGRSRPGGSSSEDSTHKASSCRIVQTPDGDVEPGRLGQISAITGEQPGVYVLRVQNGAKNPNAEQQPECDTPGHNSILSVRSDAEVEHRHIIIADGSHGQFFG